MLTKDLKKLDLNDKESKVYLALLELGESNIQQIAKKSGVKRTTVYDILESLKEKGLLSSATRNKKVLYSAEDPRTLEEKLNEKKITLQKIMPELLSIANALDKKPRIRFFEGSEGIKDVFRDTLNYPNQELTAWMPKHTFHYLDQEFIDYYLEKRVEKKIWARVISPDTPEIRDYQKTDQKFLKKTKIIDGKNFPVEVEINLYGGFKIGIMAFEEKIGLIIESKKIYTTLKSVFEMNWDSIA